MNPFGQQAAFPRAGVRGFGDTAAGGSDWGSWPLLIGVALVAFFLIRGSK